ncbi:MAG: hypothetical protein ACJA0H_001622 [Francisellaceae bacterium]|jgi:hypothetical protein
MFMGVSVKNYFIYILKLENCSWYVGTAENLVHRLTTHAMKSPYSIIDKKAGGSTAKKGLTGIRKAISLHAAFSVTCSEVILTEIEDAVTASMGNKYGYDVVRGGTWHQLWGVRIDTAQVVKHRNVHSKENIRSSYNLQELKLNTMIDEIPFRLTEKNI